VHSAFYIGKVAGQPQSCTKPLLLLCVQHHTNPSSPALHLSQMSSFNIHHQSSVPNHIQPRCTFYLSSPSSPSSLPQAQYPISATLPTTHLNLKAKMVSIVRETPTTAAPISLPGSSSSPAKTPSTSRIRKSASRRNSGRVAFQVYVFTTWIDLVEVTGKCHARRKLIRSGRTTQPRARLQAAMITHIEAVHANNSSL
jgi:hypothetical protein